MADKQQVMNLIFDALDTYIEQMPDPPEYSKSEATILYGDGGILDSIGLVGFIVEVEQSIEETFKKAISIADEKAMSQKNSPFRTISTLTDYVMQKLEASS